MYHHCVHCAADLGANEAIEGFPVGRRLAFNAGTGRLWVICGVCARWNLTPLEERWEAIESCERLYRDTPRRVATDQIGLARVPEGLELVRIGRPLRPEFAAWRYGDQLGRRRMRYIVRGGLGAAALTVATVGLHVAAGSYAALLAATSLYDVYMGRKPAARIPLEAGGAVAVRRKDVAKLLIRSREDRWRVIVPVRSEPLELHDTDAMSALRLLMPHINEAGSSQSNVRRAVADLEQAGGPHGYLLSAERRASDTGYGVGVVSRAAAHVRLAIEMAANEETERLALEGELGMLERAWREAEELARIADDLIMPERVTRAMTLLKGRNS